MTTNLNNLTEKINNFLQSIINLLVFGLTYCKESYNYLHKYTDVDVFQIVFTCLLLLKPIFTLEFNTFFEFVLYIISGIFISKYAYLRKTSQNLIDSYERQLNVRDDGFKLIGYKNNPKETTLSFQNINPIKANYNSNIQVLESISTLIIKNLKSFPKIIRTPLNISMLINNKTNFLLNDDEKFIIERNIREWEEIKRYSLENNIIEFVITNRKISSSEYDEILRHNEIMIKLLSFLFNFYNIPIKYDFENINVDLINNFFQNATISYSNENSNTNIPIAQVVQEV